LFYRIEGNRKFFRKYYLKLEYKRSLKKILSLYAKRLFLFNKRKSFKSIYSKVVYLLLPARQHRISLLDFKEKDVHLSAGNILKCDKRMSKCLKRQSDIILTLMFFFKKFYSKKLL
jgi:hypothetical protein